MSNKTLFIIVEGDTEQGSLPVLLASHFRTLGFRLQCVRIGEARARPGGGNFNLSEFSKWVALFAHNHRGCFISTCFDYYKLGNGWPEYLKIRAEKLDKYIEIRKLEAALADFVKQKYCPEILWGGHFIPHIQLHEIETLLFSQPEVLAGILDDGKLAEKMKNVIRQYGNCELINENYNTCPSRRLENLTQGRYVKGKSGAAQMPTFMQQADLAAIRGQCRHFDAWLTRLETSLAR